MKDLTKDYPQVEASERFKLMLAALALGDEAEARQLEDSCLDQHYIMGDADYVGRMDSSRIVVASAALDWLVVEKRLAVAEKAHAMYLEYLRKDYELPTEIEATIKSSKSDLKAYLTALEVFADQIGVPLDQMVLTWYPPLMEWIESRRSQLADAELDQKTFDKVLTCYSEYWESNMEDWLSKTSTRGGE
ncbi:MAG: hypothetical protein ABSA82_00360 [Thermacetogeniaceae bacterium]|jgi:hypothetical protein